MKKLIGIVCCLVMISVLPLMAFEKGDIELTPSLQIVTADNLSTTEILLEGGYHFTDKHQGSALLEYKKVDVGVFDTSGGFFGVGYDYNFVDVSEKHVPFLGGGLKLPISDFGDIYDKVLFIHGGFKSFFVPEKVALRSSLDIEQYYGEGNIDDDMSLTLRFGVVIVFKAPTFESSKKGTKKSSKKKTGSRRGTSR